MDKGKTRKSNRKPPSGNKAGPSAVPRIKKLPALNTHSFIETQEQVDEILKDFNISGVKAIPPKPTDTMNNPPDGYFAFSAVHIWHGGFLPFPPIILSYLQHLKVAPTQLSPNVYTYLLALEIMSLESGGSSLVPAALDYLLHLAKSSDPSGLIYRTNPLTRLVDKMVNKSGNWECQFFFVQCPEGISGAFSPINPASTTPNPGIKEIYDSLVSTSQSIGSKDSLLRPDLLRKYSLLPPGHKIFGRAPTFNMGPDGQLHFVSGRNTASTSLSPFCTDPIDGPHFIKPRDFHKDPIHAIDQERAETCE